MAGPRRVIGSEHVDHASRRGRRFLEVQPGSIVTEQARDSAARLGVELRLGPLDLPAAPASDGPAALYRGLYRRNPKWMAASPAAGRNPVTFRKVAVVGAGGVGAALAQLVFDRNAAERVALIDLVPGLAESLALDMNHSSGVSRADSRAEGGTDAELTANADVIVVTAGRPRAPGMDRSELLSINRRVIRSLAETIRSAAPNAVVIVVSNPLDEMTAEMLAATQFPRERVLGMAGTLDSARFRQALATAAGVGISEVDAMVIGSHGAEMVPLISLARLRGMPLRRHLSEQSIADCVERTVSAGARVVNLRKTASASIAPAHSALEMLEYMRGALAGSVPATVALDGEFGISGVAIGVPCRLGLKGLIEVDEAPISDAERRALARAAEAVRSRLAG